MSYIHTYAQLEDERQQDEHGQCMVEEISEIKLRRAICTLEKAKEQATEQMQALRAVPKPTREQRVELEMLVRNAVCLHCNVTQNVTLCVTQLLLRNALRSHYT